MSFLLAWCGEGRYRRPCAGIRASPATIPNRLARLRHGVDRQPQLRRKRAFLTLARILANIARRPESVAAG